MLLALGLVHLRAMQDNAVSLALGLVHLESSAVFCQGIYTTSRICELQYKPPFCSKCPNVCGSFYTVPIV